MGSRPRSTPLRGAVPAATRNSKRSLQNAFCAGFFAGYDQYRQLLIAQPGSGEFAVNREFNARVTLAQQATIPISASEKVEIARPAARLHADYPK